MFWYVWYFSYVTQLLNIFLVGLLVCQSVGFLFVLGLFLFLYVVGPVGGNFAQGDFFLLVGFFFI